MGRNVCSNMSQQFKKQHFGLTETVNLNKIILNKDNDLKVQVLHMRFLVAIKLRKVLDTP